MVLQKKPPLLLTLGAALLFIGGGALAFWATSRRGTLVKALPTGSNAIPEDAVLVLALSSDEAQWRRLRQFGTPASQAQFDQLLAQGRKRLLSDQNINFATDIQPWVGPEVTLAVLPTSSEPAVANTPEPIPDPETALTSNLVIVVPIADALKAQTGLGKRLDEATPLEEEPYRGVTVQQINREGETPLFAAVLNREMAILSPQLPLLKRSIDAYKGGKSLVNRPGFSRAFEQIEDNQPLARWYMDVPAAVQTAANAAEPPLPASSLEALQVPRGIAGVAMVKSRGLHLQAISWLDQGSQVFATGNPASQMPQRLPAETLLMASGGDFQQFWEDFQSGRQLSALLPFRPDDISLTLQSATGLTFAEDLLPWMAGEFALGVLAPPNPPEVEGAALVPNPALVMLVKTSDREAATAAFDRLNTVMESRYRFSVDALDMGGVPVTRWTAPFDSLSLAYGWLEGDIVFFTIGNGIAEMVAPAPERPLGVNPLFQATTGEAPRPNNGHFFVNLTELAAAENNLLLPPLPRQGLLGSDAIEAIGVTATVLSDRQVQYDILAALKRGNRPGSLPQPGGSAPPVEPSPPPAPSPEPPAAE